MLVRLTYCSRSTVPITPELVASILENAQRHNADSGITGLLCYSNDIFVQALEGSRAAVNRLYQQLCHDERHHDITLLDYCEIEQRQYANWSMAQAALDRKNAALLLRYSDDSKLDPFALNGASTIKLLEELSAAGGLHMRP